jgi:hypothetical protein
MGQPVGSMAYSDVVTPISDGAAKQKGAASRPLVGQGGRRS